MVYRIGSFNMYKFSYNSNKNYDKIADIIIKNRFDIVAMQEVLSPDTLNYLVRKLNSKSLCDWKYSWDSPSGISSFSSEGYAFLWRGDRIELSKKNLSGGNGMDNRVYPQIFRQYRVDRSMGQIKLARDPYYARFMPKNGVAAEFRILNIHIRFNKSDEENGLGAINERKNEINILIKSILPKIVTRRYGNNMPSYTILLGDYNMEIKGDNRKGPFMEQYIIYNDFISGNPVRDSGKQVYETTQSELSTLKKEEDDSGYLSHNYDHATFEQHDMSEVMINSVTINTVEKEYQGDYDLHKKEISDHIPIIVSLDFIATK